LDTLKLAGQSFGEIKYGRRMGRRGIRRRGKRIRMRRWRWRWRRI
jgi:hypothetical protein